MVYDEVRTGRDATPGGPGTSRHGVPSGREASKVGPTVTEQTVPLCSEKY